MTAIFHLDLQTLSRRLKRSMVQMAAYLTGQRLMNRETGKANARRSTEGVCAWELVGTSMPLGEFMNLTQEVEKRRNATVGRHVIVALPDGMAAGQQYSLLKELAEFLNRDLQVPVLIAMHTNPQENGRNLNPHGHLLFGGRAWDEETKTFAPKRIRKLYERYGGGPKFMEALRREWEQIVNASLPVLVPPVSRLSHARRRNGRIPRRHLGYHATAMERTLCKQTRDGEFNALIDELDAHDAALADVRKRATEYRQQLETKHSELEPMRASESRAIAALEAKQAAMEAEAKVLLTNPRVKSTGENTTPKQAPEPDPSPEDIDVLAPYPNPARRKVALQPTPAELEELEELLRPFRRRPPQESLSLEEFRVRQGTNDMGA
ncbi:MAG: MobA/MobL family protein [Opitutaceae bacterium]|nr:MobA/MobL family protein [Opitutaceae bacterium]